MSQLLGHFGVRRLSVVESTQRSGLKHHIFGEISCPCSQSQGDPGDLDLAGTSAGHELVSKWRWSTPRHGTTPSSWVWRGGEVNPRHAQHVALLTLGPKCSLLASIFIVSPANPSSRMPGVIFSSLPPYWWAPFNPVTGTAIFKVGLNDASSPACCFTCFWGSVTCQQLRHQFTRGDALKCYFWDKT